MTGHGMRQFRGFGVSCGLFWFPAVKLCSVRRTVGFLSAEVAWGVLAITCPSVLGVCNRTGECMRDGVLAAFDGDGGTVEVNETFICQNPKGPRRNARVGLRIRT